MNSNNSNPVLIVDDNPTNVLLTDTILRNRGYDTLTALSGIAALELLKDHLPALILLDVMMPDMDGLEVCRIIKKNPDWIDIPIIFLTANTQTDDIIRGFEAGGVDYITKPFKPEELVVRVNTHLELFNSRRTIIEMNKRILEMNKNRDKLYSIIAHDIRSPLSGIRQTLYAIDQGFFDPGSDDFKELMHQLSERTKDTDTLLSSLLDWTRYQGDKMPLQISNTNLFVILGNCKILLDASAENKKIQLSLQLNDDLYAFCDEVTIHTVFRNIISNAIKFTRNGGFVTISSDSANGYTNIIIEDNGIGIPEDKLHKIMESEEVLSTSGTNNEQGTGLGLLIVRDFIRKNNGKLSIVSSPGIGTKVIVSLPKEF